MLIYLLCFVCKLQLKLIHKIDPQASNPIQRKMKLISVEAPPSVSQSLAELKLKRAQEWKWKQKTIGQLQGSILQNFGQKHFFKSYHPMYTLARFDLTTHSSYLLGGRRSRYTPLGHATRGLSAKNFSEAYASSYLDNTTTKNSRYKFIRVL
jgi:hypothetical protein